MSTHILRKEGKHYKHRDLEFWAEDGLVFIEDRQDGTFNVVTCADFKARGRALMGEEKRAYLSGYSSDARDLRDWLNKMAEVYAEAKMQGDPSDPAIAMQKYRERRKAATIVTGMW